MVKYADEAYPSGLAKKILATAAARQSTRTCRHGGPGEATGD